MQSIKPGMHNTNWLNVFISPAEEIEQLFIEKEFLLSLISFL